MKLRNKKTGEIVDDVQYRNYSFSDGFGLRTKEKDYEYKTLAKFIEEWEDALAEPLIKDEKVRKAVRAWAELFNIDELRYMELHGVSGHYLCHLFHSIDVPDIEGLKVFNYYTIAELCGE